MPVLQIAEIQEAFKLFDTDNSGSIDYRELKVPATCQDGEFCTPLISTLVQAALTALGFPAKKADVQQKMAMYDREETGKISQQQFQLMLTDAMLSRSPAETMSRAFQLFDTQGFGRIGPGDLRMIANELGHEVDDQDLLGMIEMFDTNRDGVIDAAEFQSIMTSAEAL